MGLAREYDNHEWQIPVNKVTLDAMHQVEQLWKKTERLVDAIDFQPEQQQLKEATVHTVQVRISPMST